MFTARRLVIGAAGGAVALPLIGLTHSKLDGNLSKMATDLRISNSMDWDRENYVQPPENLVVRQVVVLLRHGDRGPIATRAGVINTLADADFWNSQLPTAETDKIADLHCPVHHAIPGTPPRDSGHSPNGQLTNRGVLECLAAGRAMRRRYIESGSDFLGDDLADEDTVLAFATNICRTRKSAQHFLLGLYPPHNRPTNTTTKVNVRKDSDESLLPDFDGKCSQIWNVLRQESLRHDKQMDQDFKNEVKQKLGYEDRVNWAQAREVMTCNALYDRFLPPGVDKQFVEKVIQVTTQQWESWYSGIEAQRLAVGRLLTEITQHMQGAALKHTPVKVILYTAHDSSVLPLRQALGLYGMDWPPYASAVAIELLQDKNTQHHFVRLVCDDKSQKLFGKEFCPLSEVVDALQPVLVRNSVEHESVCRTKKPASRGGDIKRDMTSTTVPSK